MGRRDGGARSGPCGGGAVARGRRHLRPVAPRIPVLQEAAKAHQKRCLRMIGSTVFLLRAHVPPAIAPPSLCASMRNAMLRRGSTVGRGSTVAARKESIGSASVRAGRGSSGR